VLLHNEIEWNSPLMWTVMKAAIGQPINLSLCVYAVFWEGNLWTAAHTASAWEVSKQRNHAMLQKAVFRLAMPYGTLVTSFSLLLFSPQEILALLLVHRFRYFGWMQHCKSATSFPCFDRGSTHRMRWKKERPKETNHPCVCLSRLSQKKTHSILHSVMVVGYRSHACVLHMVDWIDVPLTWGSRLNGGNCLLPSHYQLLYMLRFRVIN
jgi:hypothetical protein